MPSAALRSSSAWSWSVAPTWHSTGRGLKASNHSNLNGYVGVFAGPLGSFDPEPADRRALSGPQCQECPVQDFEIVCLEINQGGRQAASAGSGNLLLE